MTVRQTASRSDWWLDNNVAKLWGQWLGNDLGYLKVLRTEGRMGGLMVRRKVDNWVIQMDSSMELYLDLMKVTWKVDLMEIEMGLSMVENLVALMGYN